MRGVIDRPLVRSRVPPMTVKTGDPAPDFTLTTLGAEGPELVTLSAQAPGKKTLLLFFPMAFTGGCTTELCSVTAGIDEYTGLGAQVFGISGDNPFAQAAWAEKEGIGITLLSDYEHEVANVDLDVDSFSFSNFLGHLLDFHDLVLAVHEILGKVLERFLDPSGELLVVGGDFLAFR